MSFFYELLPLDTLFFRGSAPMEAGQNAAVSLFPPPVSVIEGAIRTCVLKEHDIDIQKYTSGEDVSVNELIGSPSEKAPFDITAILIKRDETYYAKAPVTWYLDSKAKPKEKSDYIGNDIVEARQNQTILDDMSVMGSVPDFPFARAKHNLQPLGNMWISVDFLNSPKKKLTEDDFLLQSEILSFEDRTGIGLDSNKHTEEGQLYSSVHIRLRDGISIVAGISKDVGLSNFGKIYLGGEKRICSYRKIDFEIPDNSMNSANQFLSFVPVEATEETLKCLIASAKLSIVSGWDLAKKFHKPTSSWISAGAVFAKNINGICIPLSQIGE